MENVLSKQQLESMSTADLISLSDEYGIEIPDNLNRRFIIEELLETSAELESSFENDDEEVTLNDEKAELPETLPKSYNETEIDLVLRNPEWIFVYWDISEAALTKIKNSPDFSGIFLHLDFYDSMDEEEKPNSSINIKINLETREQYVLVPEDKNILNVVLACSYGEENFDILASSRRISIPRVNDEIKEMQPGKKMNFPPLVNISGLKLILHNHYLNHGEFFS